MNLYSISLFVHMMGLISLFGAFVLLQNSGRRLRSATTWQEARPWLDLLRPINGMLIGGPVMMLASGWYMAREQWGMSVPFVVVGVVSAVLLLILGPWLVGRKLAQLRHMAGDSQGVVPEEGRARLRSPSLWSPMFAMNGAALGMVWIMSTKPGWIGAIAIPLSLGVMGSLIGSLMKRPHAVEQREDRWGQAMSPPLARGRRSG